MRDLARWVPMGLKGETELKGLAWGGVVSLLYSLTFWLNFSDAYNELFQYVGNQRVLMEDARMPLFAELLAESRPMAGFWITAACMAALAVWHYAYHYQGSRSIYLMRRLPSRWELWRRCLALPAAGAVCALLLAALLLLCYFGLYLLLTPRPCLQPGQWAGLGRYFLGGAL